MDAHPKNKRPDLNEKITMMDFTGFYWLKKELEAFCKKNGLEVSGGKIELSGRIAQFIETGEKLPGGKAQKVTSTFDWNISALTMETIITDSYKNTENVRAFFMIAIGKHFRFNTAFMNWMKQNAGRTLADAVAAWKEIDALKKNAVAEKDIPPQFEYNTYIRDFFKNNPGLSLADAQKCWIQKKQLRGSRKYNQTDINLIT